MISKNEISHLRKSLNGKEEPYKLDLFLTQACNLNCKFCDCHKIDYKKIKYELGKDEFLRILKEANELGIKKVGILGGEPFVKTDLMLEIMSKIKEYSIDGALTTNGTLFNRDSIKKIVGMEWNMIRFSIDGKRRIHDYLRGQKGTFNKVINSLRLFNEIKRQRGNEFPTLEINFVLTNKNYKDLAYVLKLVNKFDCKKFYILPLIELNQECPKLKINNMNKKIEKYLKKALSCAERYSIESNIKDVIESSIIENSNNLENFYEKENKEFYCTQPWRGMAIHSNGNVVVCANFEDTDGINIKDTHLEDIWFGKYFKKIRKNMKEGKLPKVCSRCCAPNQFENKEIIKLLKNEKVR
jgi:MoaA/NifB/PqqE/SkfB family radical SAM enzyme